jgi:hypothetical protein
MPTPWRRGVYDKVDYVVVERDGVLHERELVVEEPTATVDRQSRIKRQEPSPTNGEYDSDSDEDDYPEDPAMTAMTTPSLMIPSGTPAVRKTRRFRDLTDTSSFSLQ